MHIVLISVFCGGFSLSQHLFYTWKSDITTISEGPNHLKPCKWWYKVQSSYLKSIMSENIPKTLRVLYCFIKRCIIKTVEFNIFSAQVICLKCILLLISIWFLLAIIFLHFYCLSSFLYFYFKWHIFFWYSESISI